MIDYQNRLNQAREEIARAQEQLINAYSEQIKGIYLALPIDKKKVLLEGLERLLDNPEIKNPVKTKVGFDPAKARAIRKAMGLKQAELAKQLGINQSRISNYETDRIRRGGGKAQEKYINWLRKRGYQD